jgi:hypothetical protein
MNRRKIVSLANGNATNGDVARALCNLFERVGMQAVRDDEDPEVRQRARSYFNDFPILEPLEREIMARFAEHVLGVRTVRVLGTGGAVGLRPIHGFHASPEGRLANLTLGEVDLDVVDATIANPVFDGCPACGERITDLPSEGLDDDDPIECVGCPWTGTADEMVNRALPQKEA